MKRVNAVTQDETVFWNLVHEHSLREFGYSVVELKLDSSGQTYTLRLKRLSKPDSRAKRFTVFNDQLRNSVSTGQLPGGLLRAFADKLK